MTDFARFWRFYRYPARQWSQHIRQVLESMSLPDKAIVDAPCGDGVIAFWLIKYGVGNRYELYDISERAVPVAQRMLTWPKAKRVALTIERCDISEVPAETKADDIWLLINSLFLLPNIDQLIPRMRRRAQTIIGVFPNVASDNYRRYVAQTPNRNINAMEKEDTIAFFAKHGYQLKEAREFCYVPLMHLKSKYTRLAAAFLVNPIEGLFPRREPCYWMGVFSRDESDESR